METELGLEYCGRIPKKERGEKREEVRKRMEKWNARVERVHKRTSITTVSLVLWRERERKRGGRVRWDGVGIRKNMYWMTMGCWASLPKLLFMMAVELSPNAEEDPEAISRDDADDGPGADVGPDFFSIRAQVR